MGIAGLWHGANYNFILWGFLNGLILCIERFLKIEKALQKNNIKINSKNIYQLWNDAKIKEELNNE